MKAALWLAAAVAALATPQAPPAAPADPRTVHIVLVGDSTVTEGSGWGLGFRQLAGPGVAITNTAQNGRSSKSFRDEGHWAKSTSCATSCRRWRRSFATIRRRRSRFPPTCRHRCRCSDSRPGRENGSAGARVYTRALRLERYRRRMAHNGRETDIAGLPPVVTSPAILVAWDFDRFVPWEPCCDYAPDAPTQVEMRPLSAPPRAAPPELQPLAVTFARKRIRELLGPYETHVEQTQWLAVLDPDRLRADTLLLWTSTKPCAETSTWSESPALITQDDVARWRGGAPPPPRVP